MKKKDQFIVKTNLFKTITLGFERNERPSMYHVSQTATLYMK
jgi:hypothetical protein